MSSAPSAVSPQTIQRFIDRFTSSGHNEEVINAFTNGCCYWFARILASRFGGTVVYHPVDNHFAAEIGGKIYDITGNIGHDGFLPWNQYSDSAHRARIIRDCILFTEVMS